MLTRPSCRTGGCSDSWQAFVAGEGEEGRETRPVVASAEASVWQEGFLDR